MDSNITGQEIVNMEKKYTIKNRSRLIDVAKMANVSTATVSHVVNNTRFVSEEIRHRVLTAIKTLHYFPSDIARSLATKKTKTIGIIISDVQNPFYGPLIRSIESVLQKSDYKILFANNDESEKKENFLLQTFFSKGIDGLILTPAGEDISFLEVMESVGIKIVIFDRIPKRNPFVSVTVDNKISSSNLIHHLLDDGHERIGIILGWNRSTINERFMGYREAILDYGIPFLDELVQIGGSQQRGGYEATKKLLQLENKPTAIFATNNLMILGALFALKEMNLQCPKDIALVGFDDTSWAPVFHPPLTMIRQPVKEIGITAANLLLKQLNDETLTKSVELRTTLEIRGSCSLKCLENYKITIETLDFREYPFNSNFLY